MLKYLFLCRQLLVTLEEELKKSNTSPSNGVTDENSIAGSSRVDVDIHNVDENDPFIEKKSS